MAVNLTEAKKNINRSRNITNPVSSTRSYKSYAESEYEKKKNDETKRIHEEIKRVSLQQLNI